MRDYPKSCAAMIAPAVLWFVSLSLLAAQVTFAEQSTNSQMQAYYSGNGLLHRGLYDLAAQRFSGFRLFAGKTIVGKNADARTLRMLIAVADAGV